MFHQDSPPTQRPRNARTPSGSSGLLPAAQITPDKDCQDVDNSRLEDGLDIERPRSALHTGDFTNKDLDQREPDVQLNSHRLDQQSQKSREWISTSPPRDYMPFCRESRRSSVTKQVLGGRSFGTSPLSRSPSLSSSFAYVPPTSPLVHSESRDELETSDGLVDMSYSTERSARRHTLYSSRSSPYDSPTPHSNLMSQSRSLRRESTFPFQAHQPRRSLSSTTSFTMAGHSPGSPILPRFRRPSIGSESSPIQHASMVGSYEESILRGRMSTTPSKPLDFMAQIGVLGMGKCKPSLKCPSHVTLPFGAVYYSYSNTSHGRSLLDDGPSPYVGQIDLENGLCYQGDNSRSKRKAHSRYADRKFSDGDMDYMAAPVPGSDREPIKTSRSNRHSSSPRAPPGGSYRIPEKGQLQIIIKNQNKTAVKLFLVPYDLVGMEAGTKTFIRQRCYSAGPVIDGAPESLDANAVEKPTLRYLIHLHICCPSKGRFYLYKSVRVVFANRVPDDKERLKNETTWPEPRFTPYKPMRAMNLPMASGNGPAATLIADKAYRRRSSGFSFATQPQAPDSMEGRCFGNYADSPINAGYHGSGSGRVEALDPIPFRLPPHRRGASDISDTTNTTMAGPRSPDSSQASRPSTKDSSGAGQSELYRYAKLNKGDFGYGGLAFNQLSPGSPAAEGLLSQRLRSLGVKNSPGASMQTALPEEQ